MVVPNGDAGTRHEHQFHEDSPNMDERMGHTCEEVRAKQWQRPGRQTTGKEDCTKRRFLGEGGGPERELTKRKEETHLSEIEHSDEDIWRVNTNFASFDLCS